MRISFSKFAFEIVTVGSQKLLNAYCMIYYRTLAHANALHFSVVLQHLRAAAAEANREREVAEVSEVRTPIPSRPSRRIYQALQLLFQQNPMNRIMNQQQRDVAEEEEMADADSQQDTIGGLLASRNSLREGLMSFAPGSINSETAELVEHLVDDTAEEKEQFLCNAAENDESEVIGEAEEMSKCAR